MKYTLITPTGKIMTFFVQAAAVMFQQAYGGIIITPGVLDQVEYNSSITL